MSEADKTGSSFWSTLENILRPQTRPHIGSNTTSSIILENDLNQLNTQLTNLNILNNQNPNEVVVSQINQTNLVNSSNILTDINNLNSPLNEPTANPSSQSEQSSDEIIKRLNGLKQSEPIENRLQSFEELIKLSELFYLNENLINYFLKLTSDLYKFEITSLEYRSKAFEYLIQFYKKKSEKFDTFMLRNHLLCLILINSKTSKCIFLNTINSMIQSPNNLNCGNQYNFANLTTQQQLNQNKVKINISLSKPGDDIKLRFALFNLVTKQGNYCKNLDPDLTIECLIYFLENSDYLLDKSQELFELFKNLITQKFFQYLNDNLLTLLTKFMLKFSFLITNSVYPGTNTQSIANPTSQQHQVEGPLHKPLSKQQQQDIKSCIELIEKTIQHITTTVCINYVVLCLCELLDITWQNQINRSDYHINRNDSQMVNINDSIITQIYDCMNKLFISPIGNCAIFTFFNEVFPLNKKYQIHRNRQLNGALMHIKQIFDDFKQLKFKNSHLIKELHLNCLIYLPNALKHCSSDPDKSRQLIMFEHILNLTIDLVNLASHRDLFMCLLTFKSRNFLIEIVNQFSVQILENESLIKKYAELLSLLDSKDVFSYKTSSLSKENISNTSSSSGSLLRNSSSASLNKENIDEASWMFQKFKESFYDLVYKFPNSNYIKENCINNCIDFYLQRKLLPLYGNESIKGIKALLEKYLSIKHKNNIAVRKFVIEALHKKLKEYYNMDQKNFTEQIITDVLIPVYETCITEDDSYYRSIGNAESSIYNDLFEMKYFVVVKLIDLTHICDDEQNMLKIIKIFEKIIWMEKASSVELLLPSNSVQIASSLSSNTASNPNSSFLSLNGQSSCLNYLNKVINLGLIDVFEKHFHNSSKNFTFCCIEIFDILIKYLEYYYLTQHNVNTLNQLTQIAHSAQNHPFSLSSIAAESLPNSTLLQQQQTQAQSSPKYFNYYATIRRDIFEFLLRIRSDNQGKLLLINRSNRRKYQESKYLLLNLCETRSTDSNQEEYKLKKSELDFGKILKLIEYCLDKENDWHVINRVLADLPYVLQYEIDLIKNSDFTHKIFQFLKLDKKDVSSLRNKPENLTKTDYISKYYPLIACLISYHPILEEKSQEDILQNFANGMTIKNRFCLEILTIAITEMHETNASQCGEILLKLSHFTPSQILAQPILELLSTISDFKKLDSIFGRKEFIAVSAIAIKYIDPLKFNPFIILLAHYVICIWFTKCKQDFRKSYASFICKGLYQEVIVQLESLNKTSLSLKDSKSPNKLTNETQANSSNLSGSQKRLNNTEQSSQKNDGPGKLGTNPELGSNPNLIKDEVKPKTILTENMKAFYKELVEITMDFMSNNMYYDNSMNTQSSSAHNKNEFLVDRFPNNGNGVGSNLRSNSLYDSSGKDSKNNTKTRLWLVGNKIIQIKTGLFSNICLEEPSSLIIRKNRHKTNNSGSSNNKSINKAKISQAIDIPLNQNVSSKLNSTLVNDSVASSNNSSVGLSVNNSFSSASMISSFQNASINTAVDGSEKTKNSAMSEKFADSCSLNSLGVCNKSEQDFFDETIDGIERTSNVNSNEILKNENENDNDNDKTLKNAIIQQQALLECSKGSVDNNDNNDSESSNQRSTHIKKRRYKSGLPLSTDRNDDDLNEDSYLNKNFNDSIKHSKDDSELELLHPFCCYKNDERSESPKHRYHSNRHLHSHHHHHHHHYNHHRHQYNEEMVRNKIDHFYKNQLNVETEKVNDKKELCHKSCWCNNLVEITCRYPTKVVTYVSLIEANFSNSHGIDMSVFNNALKISPLIYSNEESANLSMNNKNFENKILSKNETDKTSNKALYALTAANAIELRKNVLSRISESSALIEPNATLSSNEKEELEKICENSEKLSILEKNLLEQSIEKRVPMGRKSSFDLSSISSEKMNSESSKLSNSSTNFVRSTTISMNQNNIDSSINLSNNCNSGINQPYSSIDPSQVFLQLFQTQNSYNNEKEQPLLIPDIESIKRSLNILDYYSCYMSHKIGVVYIGRNQANDEKAILSNANGSVRYRNFINGLGNLVCLKDMDTNRFYPGGLETDGAVGDFTILWFDGIIQIIFHISTMMVQRDENSVSKKRHIGNDSTIIVYNESGEEYQFNMIKGDVNCICIEIIPLKTNTNIVKVKTTSEIAQSSWYIHSDPKFVSDQNLALIVRKMALHADIASKVCRNQKESVNLYGGRWYDRLKQINRIRNMAKEYYTKQQAQQQQQQQNKSASNQIGNIDKQSSGSNFANNLSSGNQNTTFNQFDFTDYI